MLSGIAGGGGGFVMAPYWLIIGLMPAQGAATGAFMGLGMGGSSLAAFRGSGHIPNNKKLLRLLLVVTVASSVVGSFFLPHIGAEAFKPVLALLTISSLPFLFIKRKQVSPHTRYNRFAIGIIIMLLIASSFTPSSAFWVMIMIILTQQLGMTVLQGIAIRRIISLAQSMVVFTILVCLGSFAWQHALVALIGGSIGSYFGTRFSIKKGEKFAKYALAGGAMISSIALFVW